jgi:hypothetical protein
MKRNLGMAVFAEPAGGGMADVSIDNRRPFGGDGRDADMFCASHRLTSREGETIRAANP